jgi:hypothetical protein
MNDGEQLKECKFLLRQILYARCITGTKFCDELDKWNLEDLERRIYTAIGDYQPGELFTGDSDHEKDDRIL